MKAVKREDPRLPPFEPIRLPPGEWARYLAFDGAYELVQRIAKELQIELELPALGTSSRGRRFVQRARATCSAALLARAGGLRVDV